MENPATWGELERVIDRAIRDWQQAQRDGVIGSSQPAAIARALRSAGLVTAAAAEPERPLQENEPRPGPPPFEGTHEFLW